MIWIAGLIALLVHITFSPYIDESTLRFETNQVSKSIVTSKASLDKVTEREENSRRSLHCAEWIQNGHPIVLDGDASDWAVYTSTGIGTEQNQINLYMANDYSYLYICADAISDNTDNEQINDSFQCNFDGDNDNNAVLFNSTTQANKNTRDSWLTLCGDRDKQSDSSGARNDAGVINRRTDGSTIRWYSISERWIDEWAYQWKVGFNGNPAHMVYEVKIPLSKWSWNPGDSVGGTFWISKSVGGNSQCIGKYPLDYSLNDLKTWKDFSLATKNDRPYYSNPTSNPSTICNDGINETLLTLEATDPDGRISEVVINLTSIGGGGLVTMGDDGMLGDQTANDGQYSCLTTVSQNIPPDVYDLPFIVKDAHTPNIGAVEGVIRLIVEQANRRPQVRVDALPHINLIEDQASAYIDLSKFFVDPDQEDVLTYMIKTDSGWDSEYTSSFSTYRVLLNDTVKVTPLKDKYGSETIFITAKDAGGLWVDGSHNLIVSVQPINDYPRFLSINNTDLIGTSVSLTAFEDYCSTFTFRTEDVDEDPLEYLINMSDSIPGMIEGKDYELFSGNGTLKLFPKNQHVGIYYLELTVKDNNGGYDTIDILLSIININDPPFMHEIGTKHVVQDEWFEFTPVVEDADLIYGDMLKFSTNFSDELDDGLIEDAYYFNEETGDFRFRPDKTMVRTFLTYIEVEDSNGASIKRDFTILVQNLNDIPDLPSFGYSYDHLAVTVFPDEIQDIDNDDLTYTWDFGDESPQIICDENTPLRHIYAEAGTYYISLTVSDGQLSNSITKEITLSGSDGDRHLTDNMFRFYGRITDDKGNTLSNAKIRVRLKKMSTQYFEYSTDSFGNFEIILTPDSYSIIIYKEGFNSFEIDLHIINVDVNRNIKMDPDPFSSSGNNQKSSLRFDPYIIILSASLVLIIVAIILVVAIKKKNATKRKDDVQPSRYSPMIPPMYEIDSVKLPHYEYQKIQYAELAPLKETWDPINAHSVVANPIEEITSFSILNERNSDQRSQCQNFKSKLPYNEPYEEFLESTEEGKNMVDADLHEDSLENEDHRNAMEYIFQSKPIISRQEDLSHDGDASDVNFLHEGTEDLKSTSSSSLVGRTKPVPPPLPLVSINSPLQKEETFYLDEDDK